mmetsp:Transcript_112972/g.319528  ORF Transcript_112972/g.319528 Transcript_112972/m.319528 type:complete len:648 (+) Transcript_112972:86-2029(+)
MPDRLAVVAADVKLARTRYLPSALARLDLEEDSIAFELAGMDGQFTAFIADPYPGGETTVYGPDDFELQRRGTICEVVAAVLDCLEAQRTSAPDEYLEESPMGDAEHWILDESPMEPALQRDIDRAKEVFGPDCVSIAQLSVERWRVRLRFGLTAMCGQHRGEALVDETTASAWGLDVARHLALELHIPTVGYLDPSVPHVVQAVWQEGHPKFTLEKQMVQILTDFCSAVLGRPAVTPTACSWETATEDELETIRRYEAKKASMLQQARADADFGFLGQLLYYAQLRVPTLHEYCAICDQPFVVAPMMLRTVCERDLCTYQFAEFGDKITTAEDVNTQAEIVDLLVCMLTRAVMSARREHILNPYPCVYGGKDGREIVFHPKEKDYTKLQDTVQSILKLRQECVRSMGASWSTLKSRMSPDGAGLIKWIVASNRSFLAPLQDDQRIAAFQTPYQYLLISAPPERERQFQKLKRKYGSMFAYHGSPTENWHSILRNGLKNASGTKLMTNGAAHGPGIYLSLDSQMSIWYSTKTATQMCQPKEAVDGGRLKERTHQMPEMKRQRSGNRSLERVEGLVMLAVCEVINQPNLKKVDRMWVAPQEETVITRFFLVYPDVSNFSNVPITGLEDAIQARMLALRVGLPSRVEQH